MSEDLFALALQASRLEESPDAPLSSSSPEGYVNESEKCSHCGGHVTMARDYSMVCVECGLEDNSMGRVDQGPEWSSMVDDNGSKDNSRCGMPQSPLFNNWGMHSMVGKVKGMNSQQKRLQKINTYTLSNHKDRSLNKVYNEIQDACALINISPTIVELAKLYYKKVSENGITRGSIRRAMKANCVYFACINENYPRTDDEIASIFGLESRDLNKIYRRFRDCLGTDLPKGEGAQASNIIPSIVSNIDSSITGRTIQRIILLCTHVETNMDFVGKTSHGVAGACIMYVIGEEYLDAISEATHVSKNTLIKFRNSIEELVNIIITVEGEYHASIREPNGNIVVLADVSTEKEAVESAMVWLRTNRNGRKVTIYSKNKYKNKDDVTFKVVRLKTIRQIDS
jgi:transcription initiation factor TFIIB